MSFPSGSRILPKKVPFFPKADLRRPISAWAALVWAYAVEAVRAASNVTPSDTYAATGYAASRLGSDVNVGGLINGSLQADDDAVEIDRLVWAWFDGDGARRDRLARAAERREPPPADVSLPAFACRPVLKTNGKPEMLYPISGKNEPYLCLVSYDGVPPWEAQRIRAEAREFHALVVGLLDVMPGLRLVKWKVEGRGLDSGGRIIDNRAHWLRIAPGR